MGMFDHPAAFSPFYDLTASVTGTRREAGAAAARSMRLAVPCCLLGGEQAAASAQSMAPVADYAYTVLIRKADWPDHLQPQRGDLIAIESYPALAVVSVTGHAEDWALACNTTEAA